MKSDGIGGRHVERSDSLSEKRLPAAEYNETVIMSAIPAIKRRLISMQPVHGSRKRNVDATGRQPVVAGSGEVFITENAK